MSIKKLFSFAVIALASFYSSAEAQTVLDFTTFTAGGPGELLNTAGTVVGTPFTISSVVDITNTTVPGLSLTVTGAAADTGAVLNGTLSGFGINSATGADDSNGIDGGAFGESLTLVFNQDVTITDVEFDAVDDSDASTDELSFGGVTIAGSDLGFGDTFNFAPSLFFSAGTGIVFSEISGDGSGLQELTIEVTADSPAIPEPSSAVLIALGLSGLSVLRRRS